MKKTAPSAAIQTPQLQAVLLHQEQLAKTHASVAQLKQLIAERQEQSASLQKRVQRVAELETEREDLLADIATGQQKQTELLTLDAELDQLKRDAEQQGTQAATEQTINGLQRKLAKAQDECDQLEQKRSNLMRSLLMACAEEVGAEYTQVATRLDYLSRRLQALDSMLRDQGQNVPLSNRGDLQIPRFSLSTMPASRALHQPAYLYSHVNETFAATFSAAEQEKTALRAAGVQIG